MPSTYSPLKIQLMATGENNTTWGDVTNLNLGTAIEEAIVGSADVTFASGDVTLTLTDTNASQTARNMRLRCTGTTGGSTRNLVVPSIEKPYIVKNDCADSVVVKTAAGTGITVPTGKTMWVYSDGTNVVDAVTHLSSLTLGTDLSVADGGTGASTFTANGVLYGNGASALQVTAAGTTGQVLVGNTGSAPSWATLTSTAVTSISFGTTGLTPSTATQGAVTVAGTLGVANGGTGATSLTSGYLVKGNGTSAASASVVYDDGTNVGIGTTTANGILSVVGNQMSVGSASGSSSLGIQIKGTTLSAVPAAQVQSYIATGNSSMGVAGDLLIAPRTDVAANIRFITGTSPAERMRIVSNGDVGIGTTDPTSILQASASSSSTGLAIAGPLPTLALYDNNGTTGTGFIAQVNTDTYVYNKESGNLLLGTTNTERMRITSTGNVGIGTSAPSAKLEVSGDIIASAQVISATAGTSTIAYTFGGQTVKTGMGCPADGTLSFYAGGATERMRIDATGNVGIGTTAPGVKLDVIGTVRSNSFTATGTTAFQPQTTMVNHAADATGGYYIFYKGRAGGTTSQNGDTLGTMLWYGYDTGNASVATSSISVAQTGAASAGVVPTALIFSNVGNIECMRITSAGNVGIGTSAPAVKLDIRGGDLQVSRTASGAGDAAINFGSNANNYIYGGNSSNIMAFATNGSERVRIDNNGNVGVGTSSPTFKFVSANNVSDGQWFGGSTTLSYMGLGNYRDAAGGAAQISYERTTGAFVFGNGSRDTPTERMRIDGSGNVAIGTTTPVGGRILTVNGSPTFISAGSTFNIDLDGSSGANGVGLEASFAAGGYGPLRFRTGGAETMRIDSSGNVGIGTSAPGQTLQVVNGGNYQFRLGAGSAFNYDLGRNSSDGLLYFYGNQSGFTGYVFGGADGERMRITPQGNLQLGKASLATNAADGFPYIPTCAGTPTGTPTAITGYAPMVVDSTNNKLYVYVGGAWQAMN